MAKVCVMTSAHAPFNTRVFHKFSKTLARAGYDVTLVVPHDKDETVDGVRIKAVKKPGSKPERMLVTSARVLAASLKEKADVYHFHDPELIPAGLLLRFLGKKVIYDVHEYYLLKLIQKNALAARAFDAIENAVAGSFSGLVTVDGTIASKFGGKAEVISNFPYLPEGYAPPEGKAEKFTCVYVGGFSGDRGLYKMVEAMGRVDGAARLVLAGYGFERHRDRVEAMEGYKSVRWVGMRPWRETMDLLSSSHLGLLLLQPTPSYSQTGEGIAKLFEYMMMGLPVLASDFPNIRKIIEREGCGVTVDPTDPKAIAQKIVELSADPAGAAEMGRRGREAVLARYNWGEESKKLLALYERLLEGRA